ncbi:MAG TPA: FUSC family protein, partial [Acidimicrobiales bacterium]|nr:FUSC family protein [Acidimicrobiales bacterium]
MLEPKVRSQLVTALFVPCPMIAALALGLAVNSHRLLSLVLLAACAGAGTYLRRFGARGARAGVMLFVGFFLGYFLHGVVAISALGWLAAEIGLGTLVAVVIHLIFFAPRHRWALRRTRLSYAARARKTARLALAVFDEHPNPGARRGRQLRRQLIRLNEAALMIDAQLALPGVLADGSSARCLHERLFDIELALTNVARFAHALGRMDLPNGQRALIRQALIELYHENLPAARTIGQDLIALVRDTDKADGQGESAGRLAVVIPHRFATSVITLADTMTEWLAGPAGPASEDEPAFQPSVHLAGGWLHGSALVSAQASTERGPRIRDRVRLEPYTRAAIHMTVGLAIAIAAGDALSDSRFYWAMLAVYVTLMGTNNAGEQSRKALFRVAGTVAGVLVGIALADAVGHHTDWAIVVVLAAQFFAFYFQRVNYALFVVGLVTALSQLYVQLGAFSDSLLLTRLEETALGGAIAVLVVMTVLPLRTGHVGRVAIRHHLVAMASLVAHASEQLLGADDTAALRSDARALDTAHQALVATIEPLTQNPFGDLNRRAGEFAGLTSAYRHYGRALVADLGTRPTLDKATRDDLERACQTLNASIDELVRAVDGPRDGT